MMPDELRRGPGRPPLSDGHETTQINFRLPDYLHDAVCAVALHEGISVGAVIRRALILHVRANSVTTNPAIR